MSLETLGGIRSMRLERETGILAYRQQENAKAIASLEIACSMDPNDFEGLLYLGAAYSKDARHMDALDVLTRAINLQPENPQARFSLGMALERAEYYQQATEAMNQAVTLQPGYYKAQEAIERIRRKMESATQQEDINAGAAQQHNYLYAPPSYEEAAYEHHNYVSQPQPEVAVGNYANGYAPANYAEQPNTATQQPPAVFAPPPQDNEDGKYSPDAYFSLSDGPMPGMLPPKNKLTPITGSASISSNGNGQTLSHNAEAHTKDVATILNDYPIASIPREDESARAVDKFDLGEAAKNWFAVMSKPLPFFKTQVGKIGVSAPYALMVYYLLCMMMVLPQIIMQLSKLPSNKLFKPEDMINGAPLYLGVGICLVVFLIMTWVLALGIHTAGYLFGNTSPMSVSFRAVVLSMAPLPIVWVITSLLNAAIPDFYAITGIVNIVALGWSMALLCLSVSQLHQVSMGAGIVTVFLGLLIQGIVSSILVFVLVFFLITSVMGTAKPTTLLDAGATYMAWYKGYN